MKRTDPKSQGPSSREDRLRAALRANLQRRKAQARARDREAEGGQAGCDDAEEKES